MAIVVYIDGSFIKHQILVKSVYVTVCNLNSVVSCKACAWRVLGMMLNLGKSGRRTVGPDCIMLDSATL